MVQHTQLKDICEILNGYAFKSSKYVDKGIRVIRITNVQKGYIEDDTPQYYPTESEKEIEKYMLQEGDLLMSLTGNVGRVAILKKEMLPAALNQRVACLRLKESSNVYKPYLFHLLNSDFFEKQCIFSAQGIAQKNMSTEWLKKYQIPLYSIEKQKDIAELFDQIDGLIDDRKKQKYKLEELVKSRFIELFGDPVSNPLKWDMKSLLKMGYCKNGMNFHTGDSGIEVHCLGVGDFKDYAIIDRTENLPMISLKEMPSDENMLQDGDIVFVRSNGNKALVGRCVIVYPHNILTTYSGFCIRYRLTGDEVIGIYLLQVLKTDSMRKKMAGRGANIQNLNQQILASLNIPLPPIELQNQFADFVAHVDKSKLAVQKSLDELETLKKSLMQEYFG